MQGETGRDHELMFNIEENGSWKAVAVFWWQIPRGYGNDPGLVESSGNLFAATLLSGQLLMLDEKDKMIEVIL